MQTLALSLLSVLMTISATTLSSFSQGRIVLVADPSPGKPPCEEFFDKWDVPGASTGTVAMAGLGREVMAAQDCVKQNKIPIACEHWKKLLTVVDRIGPPLNESRGDIEELMRQHSCTNPAPDE